jgi:hypothetical protein
MKDEEGLEYGGPERKAKSEAFLKKFKEILERSLEAYLKEFGHAYADRSAN